MLLLKISNADVSFGQKTLMSKFYTIIKVLSSTKPVQLIDLKKFVIAALDVDSKTFIVHIAIRKQEKMPVHLNKRAQI